jgi:subtilase family serine protease
VERGRAGKERNLVISPVAEADSGNYVCEAISKGEQTHLKVCKTQYCRMQPGGGGGLERGRSGKERNLVISPVAEADSGNYVCEAISKGEQTHLKVRNTVMLHVVMGRGRAGKERNLVISPVAEADSGNYVCEAISKGEQAHLKVHKTIEDWPMHRLILCSNKW